MRCAKERRVLASNYLKMLELDDTCHGNMLVMVKGNPRKPGPAMIPGK